MGTSPAIDLWTFGYGNDVATTVTLKVFIQRNFVADIFQQNLNFTGKKSKIAFLCHPLGYLGVTYMVHLWLVGKRMVDFLLVPFEAL